MSLSYIYRFIPVISSTSESTPNLAHIPTCGNPATHPSGLTSSKKPSFLNHLS